MTTATVAAYVSMDLYGRTVDENGTKFTRALKPDEWTPTRGKVDLQALNEQAVTLFGPCYETAKKPIPRLARYDAIPVLQQKIEAEAQRRNS